MRRFRAHILVAFAAGAAGCSGGVSVPLPSLPSLPANTPEFPGSSTTVYARVARGSNTCWFGPSGALDRTYIWHAKAAPEAAGGVAEILIHERFDKNQRGLKAFSITIAPKGDNAAVAVQNLKMPEALGQRLTSDAYRWARGGVGCGEGETSWTPVAPAPPEAKVVPAKKKPVPRRTTQMTTGSEKAETGTAPAKGPPKDAAASKQP